MRLRPTPPSARWLLGHLLHRLATHESRLAAAYEEIARRDFGASLDRQARVQRVILEAGIAHETQAVQWCRARLRPRCP